MSLPTSEPILDDLDPFPTSRRRRRIVISPKTMRLDQRISFLDKLARRTTPSFDFFLFSLISGAILGLAMLFDAPPFLILAALAAPFLGPVTGLSLATFLGSGRFFLLILWSTAIGATLFFLGGYMGGAAAQLWDGQIFSQNYTQVQLSWSNLVLLSLGAVLSVVSMSRSDQNPVLSNIALAYVLYLPVGMAGFGLAAGLDTLWPTGLVVFAVFISWTTLVGAVTLMFMGYRPLSFFGYLLGLCILMTSVVVFLGLSGAGVTLYRQFLPSVSVPAILPTPTPKPTQATAVVAMIPATQTPTPTVTVTTAVPTITPTPTASLIPSATPTQTITHAPTPVWAAIYAGSMNGAFIRAEPKRTGKILTSLLNGALVEVLPEVVQEGRDIWAHVKTTAGIDGWIVQSLLITATPAPGW